MPIFGSSSGLKQLESVKKGKHEKKETVNVVDAVNTSSLSIIKETFIACHPRLIGLLEGLLRCGFGIFTV